jgi:hypothetical protein
MKNTNQKRQLIERRQAWVEEIQTKSNSRLILASFAERGLATQNQLEKITALTTKQVRTVIDDLLKGKPGLPALLRSETVNLLGQRGRPQSMLLLTEDGSAVLQALEPDSSPTVPQLTDQVELAHALMEMEVYTLACAVKWKCEIEAVIPFGERQNIRVDVLLHNPECGKTMFEMEQSARAGDMVRIRGKLEQYIKFCAAEQNPDVYRDIRILFNLAPNDSMTVKRWSLILDDLIQQYGELPFRLFWLPVLKFLENPNLGSLEGFFELEAIHPDAPKSTVNQQNQLALGSGESGTSNALVSQDDLLPAFLKDQHDSDQHGLSLILRALADQTQEKYGLLAWPHENRASFFDLMRTIYLVSHYQGGPVFQNAALPVLSLVLLYRYLNMHQNRALLLLMLKARDEVRKSQNRGINLYRDTFSRMCWEFLRYHGFGRLGPLAIIIRVPHLNSDESEMNVEVRIEDKDLVIGENGVYLLNDLEDAQSSLAWVLSAFWIYGEELGLVKKKKSEDKFGTPKMERLFPDA